MFRSRFARLLAGVVAAMASVLACSGDGPTGGGGGGGALSVTGTTPAKNATSVSTTTTISATFSATLDPSSFTAGVFSVSNGVTGTVSVAGATATFTPSADLAGNTTYTATISTAAKSANGDALASAYSWSFTTAAPALPPFNFPQNAGKIWLYSDTTSGTVCSHSGCNSSTFKGQRVLLSEGTVSWQGRTAVQIRQFRFSGSGGFQVLATEHVSQSAGGFDRWTSSWEHILSYTAGSFINNTFLLSDGASYGAASTLSTGQASVPAGTFTVVRTSLHYSDTGPFNPVDIFVDRTESYADGVGMVTGGYNFSYDDNDPFGVDQFASGSFKLMAMDGAVPYTFGNESEPNEVLAVPGAQVVTRGSVIHGDVAIGDGSVIPTVSASSAEPINQDSTGVAQLEDVYAITLSGTGLVVDLVVEGADQDVDVYLLANSPGGWLVVGSGLNPKGTAEHVVLGATSGTIFIGIQAWNKPAGGRSGYWLYLH